MSHLNFEERKRIEAMVTRLFDRVTYQLLGYVPSKKKRMYFSTKKPTYTLLNLFVENLKREPTEKEKQIAKSIIDNAGNYITSLRDKTKASLITEIEGYLHAQNEQGLEVEKEELQKLISSKLETSRVNLLAIAEAESTKIRNFGAMSEIKRIGQSLKIEDPTVYFVTRKDACKHCINNHLMEDKETPKVFKLSEVKKNYLNYQEREAGEVSVFGQHPHCRCSLVFLAPGFTLKGSSPVWEELKHDEYEKRKLQS